MYWQGKEMRKEPNLLKKGRITSEHLARFAQDGYLYAIVDSTDAPLIPPKIQELGEQQAISLFKGTAKENYWAVAPYLAQVDVHFLRWLQENCRQDDWGIFLLSKAALGELLDHFRQVLIVKLPDHKNWLFRFYDPRVLQMFLGAGTTEQLKSFYGPVRAYLLKDPSSGNCASFFLKQQA